MEDAAATDIIAQEARMKDVDNASNAKTLPDELGTIFKIAGYKSFLSGDDRYTGQVDSGTGNRSAGFTDRDDESRPGLV